VERGQRLEVNAFAGEITVATWNRNAVRVQGESTGRTRLAIARSGSTLEVRTEGRHGTAGIAEVTVTVPVWLPLDLSGITDDTAPIEVRLGFDGEPTQPWSPVVASPAGGGRCTVAVADRPSFTIDTDAPPLGVGRMGNRVAVLVQASDTRLGWAFVGGERELLPVAPRPIVAASTSPYRPLVAWVTSDGEVFVYSVFERGVLMRTNVSWSIDDSRNKFQFGCEWGELIENGKMKGVVKNPNYRGVSATFWRSLSKVGDASTFEVHGTQYCGKGEPNQAIHCGHAAPACVFANVEVFGGDDE
jgi:hypothetical protein